MARISKKKGVCVCLCTSFTHLCICLFRSIYIYIYMYTRVAQPQRPRPSLPGVCLGVLSTTQGRRPSFRWANMAIAIVLARFLCWYHCYHAYYWYYHHHCWYCYCMPFSKWSQPIKGWSNFGTNESRIWFTFDPWPDMKIQNELGRITENKNGNLGTWKIKSIQIFLTPGCSIVKE